ncbi:hypothetical protein [Phormidium sp. CCY1219]|uniref:hypothetical protein n=1 Tax=Phormidium sp. CCY1219 TaxID=2886104 RepID=UPI002D1F663C|nr:hypothetical protein [Phormidium sp. CCY1219]MEB3826077.1 hypothetical protein [Phormidium sp. CCY1219]
MNFYKILQGCPQIILAAILMFFTSSCVDNTLGEFDKAIDILGNESANWRQVVQDLEKSTKETISYEIENLAKTTINTAGSEMRCNATFINDYVRHEVQKEILKRRNNLAQKIGKPPKTIPDPLPAICNAVPGNIELKGKRPQSSSIEFYGYFLNPNDIQIIAHLNEQKARQAKIEDSTSPRLIKRNLAGGQFKVSLNLGNNGISGDFLQIVDRISLKSQNQEIYSINVIHSRTETIGRPITASSRSNMKGGYSTGKATLYRNGKLAIEGTAEATERLTGVKATVNVVGVDENGNVLFSEFLDIPTACGKWDACSSRRNGRSDRYISPKIAQDVIRLNIHFSER